MDAHFKQIDQTPTSGIVKNLVSSTPAMGKAWEVAPGLWWTRLPLDTAANHVNVYLLEDAEGWTLVDTGTRSDLCRAALDVLLASEPFSKRPVTRVIATHYHPDHIGLAGEFAERGVPLWTTRLTWLYARMSQMDHRDLPYPDQLRFAERIGLKGAYFAAYSRRPPSEYPNQVAPIPYAFHRISDGDTIMIGSRIWKVITGNGHAPEHATLWSNDGLAITGDQIMPGISASLVVRGSEPDADPIQEWIDSCKRFIEFATDDIKCFPGHNYPFTGAVTRCLQMIAAQEAAVARVMEHLVRPRTAVDCIGAVYRRRPEPHEAANLLMETVGYLNHCTRLGLAKRSLAPDRAFLWHAVKK